ncbi:MAG TPA: putative lipid II flippase FtsW [Acidimicrobiales bacterium]|nr:putative lipid II flippase FtsW [Acidimicrobiales bacterium]
MNDAISTAPLPPRNGGATSATTPTFGTPPRRVAQTRPRRRGHLRVVARPTGHRSSYFIALFIIVMVLSLLGVVMVLSASAATALDATGSSWYTFERHIMWLSLGLVAMFVTLRVDYRRWRQFATPLLLASVALLIVVLMPGVGLTRNGSTRWLGYGSLTVQPAEFAKLALVLFVADLLARPHRASADLRAALRPVLLLTFVLTVLLMRQPNLGTTIVIAGIALGMLFAAGAPLRNLLSATAIAVTAASVLAFFADYRRERLLGFLDPWSRRDSEGLQTVQSLASIAEGRITGVGLGASRGKWGYLPFAHTDFIFSIIGEELGLIGAVTVVSLFAALAFVGFAVALNAPDRFGMLLALGVTIWLVGQAFINIGVALGLLPVTGLPLPFLSFGGSSLVVTLAACGMLMSVARHTRV